MEIKASVVIADASEEYRTILKKTMESTGEFQVVGSAGSGVEALRLVQQLYPQLLIMDLVLPELDGFGLLKQLQSMGDRAPKLIVVSAFCVHREPSGANGRVVLFIQALQRRILTGADASGSPIPAGNGGFFSSSGRAGDSDHP